MRILIADDISTNRLVLARAIQRYCKSTDQECTIDYAEHGEEALGYLSVGTPYDYAFIDDSMPKLSGHDLTRDYRLTQGEANQLPVIVTYSTTWPGIFPGANARLSKPFEKSELTELLSTSTDILLAAQQALSLGKASTSPAAFFRKVSSASLDYFDVKLGVDGSTTAAGGDPTEAKTDFKC